MAECQGTWQLTCHDKADSGTCRHDHSLDMGLLLHRQSLHQHHHHHHLPHHHTLCVWGQSHVQLAWPEVSTEDASVSNTRLGDVQQAKCSVVRQRTGLTGLNLGWPGPGLAIGTGALFLFGGLVAA